MHKVGEGYVYILQKILVINICRLPAGASVHASEPAAASLSVQPPCPSPSVDHDDSAAAELQLQSPWPRVRPIASPRMSETLQEVSLALQASSPMPNNQEEPVESTPSPTQHTLTDELSPRVQSPTRRFPSSAPIPISPRSGNPRRTPSRSLGSRFFTSLDITSLEGSSPETSAFLLGLSGHDVISSSDRDSEDQEAWAGRSHGRLDSSDEDSGSEGSVRRWASSLQPSRSRLPHGYPFRAGSAATALSGRATGGLLGASRARVFAGALSAKRPACTAVLRPVWSESAQAHQIDTIQPADADAGEADAVQPAAPDALTTTADLAQQAEAETESSTASQGNDGAMQSPTTEGQEPSTGVADSPSAALEDDLCSGSPAAFNGGITQTSVPADQPEDGERAAAAAAPQKTLRCSWVQDSLWDPAEDVDADADYFSIPLPWADSHSAAEANSGAGLVTAAAAQQAVAPMMIEALGSRGQATAPAKQQAAAVVPTATAAQEAAGNSRGQMAEAGALQLGGITFGSISQADLLGAEVRQRGNMGTADAASPTDAASVVVGAVENTAVECPKPAAMPVDTAVGPSMKKSSVVQVTAASVSVYELSRGHNAQGRLTAGQTTVRNGRVADNGEEVADNGEEVADNGEEVADNGEEVADQEEEEQEDQQAGTTGQGVRSPDHEEEYSDEGEDGQTVNTSLDYTAFLTDSLLRRMEEEAGSRGDRIKALSKHCLL